MSNWKYLLEKLSSKEEGKLPGPDGWKEFTKISIRCDNGKYHRYPPIKNRPLRRRIWERKSETIQEVLVHNLVASKEENCSSGEIQTLMQVTKVKEGRSVLKLREEEINQLGQDIKDVQDTMLQLGELVKTQGESLNNAAVHIDKTKTNTIKALEELEKAEKMQKSSDCCVS